MADSILPALQAISGNFGNYGGKRPNQSKLTSLVVFGDSLSDTGNLSTLTYEDSGGQFWFPPSPPIPSPNPPFGGPYYSTAPYYNSAPLPFTQNNPPKVRASNGPIWADLLPSDLGLPASKVSNFAYAGATTGYTNGLQPFLPPPLQPPHFPPLPGLLSEVNGFTTNLGSGKADPRSLYVIWAGGNDGFNLAGSLANTPLSNLQATLPFIAGAVNTAIGNIKTAVTDLASKGAHTFLIPNIPDVGAAPLFHLLPPQSKASIFVGTLFSLTFDIALAVELPKLEHSLNINIVEPDVYTLTQEALNNPQEFGFTNVTDPLIAQNPMDPSVNPNNFFWYDYQHPTTKAQGILANFFDESLSMAGNINHGFFETLPQGTGTSLANATKLASTLEQGSPGLTFSDLRNDLSTLIPGFNVSQFLPSA